MARQRARETFSCPICGEEVPVDAVACRECGSNAETGWSPDTEYDGLDLPDPNEEVEFETPRQRLTWTLVLMIAAAAATLLVSMW